jgi:Region found in RelA / SpoT proteins
MKSCNLQLAEISGEERAGSIRIRGVDWTTPKYTRQEVDQAGAILAKEVVAPAELTTALRVINNWRWSHQYTLNTFQCTLRYKAKQVYRKPLVAQRIKRLSSIKQKLIRFKEWLTLSEMQDIGGCRSIVDSAAQVGQLVDLYKGSGLKHELNDEDNYISRPKKSGYRGIHLIYRYYSDRADTYNGLKIEMQFRSKLQHAWATAVETFGTFTGQALKASQGEKDWLRFFALMGSVMARLEQAPLIPDTPDSEDALSTELRELADKLDIKNNLPAYHTAMRLMRHKELKNAHYFLVEVNAKKHEVLVRGYTLKDNEQASKDSSKAERKVLAGRLADAVLVSVDSASALRRAYPNYFLNARPFNDILDQVIGS